MPRSEVPEHHQLYQTYAVEEDSQRINTHYEYDPRFYYTVTGGNWNVYSSLIWPNKDSTPAQAEEAKLDLLAECMELQPGMRILDVGCGWGGPLTYFCKKYGVSGVGVTLSEVQANEARARAARHGVDIEIYVIHWEEFSSAARFDAIYTDEVIVHFSNLNGFFAKSWDLLNLGGRFVNKELHYSHQRWTRVTRGGEHINAIYGFTGNYRLLAQELQMLNDSGFELARVHNIPITHYHRTADFWLNNMYVNRDALKSLVGDEFYTSFRKYLKLARAGFNTTAMTIDVTVARKIDPATDA